jgi:ApbE superfamily uncharacterized protein (UPF0280 family)
MLKIQIQVEESDVLLIIEPCDSVENIKQVLMDKLIEIRGQLNQHIELYPEFLTALIPLEKNQVKGRIPEFISQMYEASKLANVGPMAAVAGITSEVLGKHLLDIYNDVDLLIENGGDIFIQTKKQRLIAIYAGESVLSNKLSIRIAPQTTPLGVCTSAGTLGHSLSFGKADAVVVLSKNTALADALATSLGNQIKSESDIQGTLEKGIKIPGIIGIVIIIGDKLGAIGQIEFA